MSHHDFATESGVWTQEMVPGAQHYYRWDISQLGTLDGDAGGSWEPKTPIMIGGAGVQLVSTGDRILGGVRTQTGGKLILGQQDLIATFPPRARKIAMSLLPTTPASLGIGQQFTSPGGKLFTYPPDVTWQKALAPFPTGLIPNFATLVVPIPKAYLENTGFGTLDGMLSSVTLNYRVLSIPGGLTPPSGTNPFMAMWSQLGPNPGLAGGPQGWQQLSLEPGQFPNAFWEPGNAYSVGQYILPIDFVVNGEKFLGFYLKCTSSAGAGRTGATVPVWNLTPGATTVDGDLVWTCIGGTGNPVLPGMTGSGLTLNDWYQGGNPQSLRIDFDATLPRNGLNLENNYYMVALNLPTDSTLTAPYNVVPMILHSLVFEFVNYTTLSWR